MFPVPVLLAAPEAECCFLFLLLVQLMNEILQLILIEVQPVAVAVMAAAAAVAIGPVVVTKNVTFDPSSSLENLMAPGSIWIRCC